MGAGVPPARLSRSGTIESMTSRKPKGPEFPEQVIDPRSGPFAPPRFRGNLPHIYKEGCSYFVTFCLFDVVGARLQSKRRFEPADDPEAMSSAFEPSISGSCLLREPGVSTLVENSLLHFQGDRYALSAWCVMPNHVHAVVTPYGNHTLLQILHSWKSFTAHEITNRLQRTGPVWQHETFDHLIRGPESFGKFVSYTEQNPVAAGLVMKPEDWPYSSARMRALESESDG